MGGKNMGRIIAVTLGVLAVSGTAYAATGEHSAMRFPAGSFTIDAHSCKFATPEADKPLGSSWAVGRVWSAYEDGRHDAIDSCLRKRGSDELACWTDTPPVTTEAPADPRGYHDTTGLDSLRAYVAVVRACMLSVAGITTP